MVDRLVVRLFLLASKSLNIAVIVLLSWLISNKKRVV